MSISSQIAKHVREIYFGGNWTTSNLKDQLSDVSREEAVYTYDSLNSIATLVYHITYYIPRVTKVLEGEPLVAKDDESWECPPIKSENEWESLLFQIWSDAENFADLIESIPDEKLSHDFHDAKYGTYFRNLIGIIEHLHYHLGQIVILKKLIKPKIS